YEYMNHWAAMRTTFAGQAAKDFTEPTWAFNNPAAKPWIVEAAATHAETAAWFDEGLAYFQPTPVSEVPFHYDDLVAVSLRGSTPAANNQIYQRPERYALASLKGEPLRVEITPGTIAWYRDRADARYELTDAAGKVLTTGKLPLDGELHRLSMDVPQ